MADMLRLKQLFRLPQDAELRIADKTFVGIDFGTSTTVVSVASLGNDGNIKCEKLQLLQKDVDGALVESELLPTIIAINDENKLLVGKGAYSLKGNPNYSFGENIWHSFKMELGKDLGPQWYNSAHPKIKSPQDATTIFFQYLKKCIENVVHANGWSENIQYAVSIPASFESNQRKDLIKALENNGINMTGQTLIDEPNAAFIGYINHDYEQKQIEFNDGYNPKVLVFDFGAGTCDISIIEITVGQYGMKTKNISISQFTELGGNDIDRYIAWNYLLPSILQNNNKIDDYTQNQKKVIVNQLLGVAEKLKIQSCKAFHFFLSDREMMSGIRRSQVVKVNIPVEIYTEYGNLKQDVFSLSYGDFIDTMKAFFGNRDIPQATSIKGQKDYNSIYATIQSAIDKAHINENEIDYVILVGGSSKNPFVQKCIEEYFTNDILIGRDIQTLVSEGAAIHSLLINGLGIPVVKPITSEPIVVIAENDDCYPIIPAGTEIPFDSIEFSNLTTGFTEKKVLEIPICVSNGKKILANLKIEKIDGSTFQSNTPVKLIFTMNADKLLKIKASCNDIECFIESENPFSNTYLTDADKSVLSAEKELYLSAVGNGKPTKQAYDKLCKALDDADREYEAAEILEEKLSHYPKSCNYNYIGVLYHNSGNNNRAVRFYKMALKETPDNAFANSNLGHSLYEMGLNDDAKPYLEKAIEIRGDYPIPMITLGDIYREEEEKEKSLGLYQRASNIMARQFENDELGDTELGWYESLARRMYDFNKVEKIKERRRSKKQVQEYNEDNLGTIVMKKGE